MLSLMGDIIGQTSNISSLRNYLEYLAHSNETHGLNYYDSVACKQIFSVGEIRRVITVAADSAFIDICPYNPFTGNEEFLFGIDIIFSENDFVIPIENFTLMPYPAYFDHLDNNVLTESNADSLGYYYTYKLLETGDQKWIWKMQDAIRMLPANGTFFLMLDLFNDLKIITFKQYNELFLGDAYDRLKQPRRK